MENIQPEWRWEEGEVYEREEHIELRHGNADTTSYENWIPVARLAKPIDHVFKVKWLVQPVSADTGSAECESMRADARKSLNFFLVEKGESDPWGYARYHCNTGANLYSSVHWLYYPNGSEGKRLPSRVMGLTAEESVPTFGDAGKPGVYI